MSNSWMIQQEIECRSKFKENTFPAIFKDFIFYFYNNFKAFEFKWENL